MAGRSQKKEEEEKEEDVMPKKPANAVHGELGAGNLSAAAATLM